MDQVQVRRRRAADLPALARVLMAQQRGSRYPFRDPLPIPVEAFLHADDALSAWTAELDGRPVGHVCRTGPADGFPDAAALNEACARAHGCDVAALGWVSTLFVATTARGRGIGRTLLDAVVGDIREAGMYPCLEVLPVDPSAFRLYRAAGWVEVLTLRPPWLTEAAGDDGPDVTVMVLPRATAARGNAVDGDGVE